TYNGVAPVSLPGQEEEETPPENDDEPRRNARREEAPKARPTIRDEPDAEGSKLKNNDSPPPRRANFLRRIFGRDG
ncbi:MAG TPA: hypothetical protein VK956_02065, partial [Verrucomicrobium sp.]|nr:hypothetical protein [Verrucomicrobium sp.]